MNDQQQAQALVLLGKEHLRALFAPGNDEAVSTHQEDLCEVCTFLVGIAEGSHDDQGRESR